MTPRVELKAHLRAKRRDNACKITRVFALVRVIIAEFCA